MEHLLKLAHVSKSFGSIRALHQVDFELGSNEIVGLVGDNGAGKSTLIKILAGVHPPDSGRMFVRGRAVDLRRFNVARARRLGIETVYQERSLGEKQPLWRNMFIGRHHTTRFGFIQVAREQAETLKILNGLVGLSGNGVRADASVRDLSGGERQAVAIGRAMYFDADIIILDEPTTALSLREVEKVLGFVAWMKKAGKSCIYISHNLSHVYSVADRFFVLDRGRAAGSFLKRDISLEELTRRLMRVSQVDGTPGN